jgi:xanthine/uracil permease
VKTPRWASDPAAPSLALFGGTVVAGFLAIVLGWRVAAHTRFVPSQIAALVSGGLAGVVLVFIGATLIKVQLDRRLAAKERTHVEVLLDEAAALVGALKATRSVSGDERPRR